MSPRSLIGTLSFAVLAMAALRCGSSGSAGSKESPDEDAAIGPGSSSGGASGSGSGGGASASGSGGGSEGGSSEGGSGSEGGTASSSGSSGGSAAAGAQSVLQRGNDLYRRATFTEPGLTAAMAPMMKPDTTFDANATFPGNGNSQNAGSASVLYLEAGPASAGCPAGATGCKATARAANAGLFFAFAATDVPNPNVFAFDETTGLAVWTAHLMTGGDGIRGTPVIDPTSRRLFVVTGNNPHLVHAISVDTGAEVTTGGWPVTLSKTTLTYNGTGFNSANQNQHGALLLLNDILYIPFGGEYGDGGTYLGWIVAIDITNPTRLAGWATQSPRSGIWGSGGLVSDGTNVIGVTGDTTSEPRSTSDSEEVVRVSGLAQFTRNAASVFVPTEWNMWDEPGHDLDFGASTPAYVPLPAGSNPPGLLVAPAKGGKLYILNGSNLSAGTYPATGGSLADLTVADTGMESVYTAPTIYTSASGLHATINVGVNPAGCPAGTKTSSEMVISTLLQPGQMPIAKEGVWCAPNAGGGHMNYPPISTTSDGVSADALVWFMNASQLEAVDGDTGKQVVLTSGAACDSVPSMSFPIAAKNRIVVSALGHLCSWSVNGQ